MEEREKFIVKLINKGLTLKATGQQIEQFGYRLAGKILDGALS